MASLVSHAIAAVAIGQAAPADTRRSRTYWLALVLCSAIPDLDVIGFRYGIQYGDLWGHRGLTHSLLFAVLLGLSAAGFLRAGNLYLRFWPTAIVLAIATASHGLLDACTNGGLGVAFFSPMDPHRYFLPWRPILVSPIGLTTFFTQRGLKVLESEAIWIWGPAFVLFVVVRIISALFKKMSSSGRRPNYIS